MRIVQWNLSKSTQPMYGVKRYEDELYAEIKTQTEVKRIQRTSNTVLAWFSDYKSDKADIVHATCQVLAPIALFRKPKKFIVTVDDLLPIVYPSIGKKDISTRIQAMLIPNGLRKVDHIIAISEFTKSEIVRLLNINELKITVINLGVDRTKYHPMDKRECKRRMGLNPDEQHILVVASNSEHKRMDVVQKVFKNIREKQKDIKLIKIGYGDKLVGEGIINLGLVPEDKMAVLYNSADVYLNTTEYDGFCLPVLEAMSCGVPVVASKRCGMSEIVPHKLIDMEDVYYVEHFIEDILSCIGQFDNKAVERSKEFSWGRTAQETMEVYHGNI